MQFEHEFIVGASFEQTWAFFLEPERVAPCLPGATLDSVGGNVFAGRWKIKLGPVTVTYRGTAQLVESDARTGMLVLEASGKEARGDGTAQATSRIHATVSGGSTRVVIRTDLDVTGRASEFEPAAIATSVERILERFAAGVTETIRATPSGSAASTVEPPAPASGGPRQVTPAPSTPAPSTPAPSTPAASMPAPASPAPASGEPRAAEGSGRPGEAVPPTGIGAPTPPRQPDPGDDLDLFAPPRDRSRWIAVLAGLVAVAFLLSRRRSRR